DRLDEHHAEDEVDEHRARGARVAGDAGRRVRRRDALADAAAEPGDADGDARADGDVAGARAVGREGGGRDEEEDEGPDEGADGATHVIFLLGWRLTERTNETSRAVGEPPASAAP